MHLPRALGWLLACLIPLAAAAQESLPSFDQLEAAGAVVGAITIDTQNIFDLDDPTESRLPYRVANALHIKTRPWLIRRMLLFKPGERVSRRMIDETERLIRSNSTVYDIFIRPIRYQDGVVDIEVRTRDTWTLQPGARVRRAGGVNSGGFDLKETNLAGTGTTLGIERSTNVDRTGSVLQLSHDHLFDGWTRFGVERGTFDDGSSASLNLTRPFYALDTRWAAGVTASKFDRQDALYESGNAVGEFRHISHTGEVFGGWSPGLVGRWTQRYSAGLSYQADKYSEDPARPLPAPIPVDKTLAGPFLRYELLEDDFVQLVNRERIQRPEYFAMGWHATLQIGRSLGAFGSTEQPWQLNAAVSKGLRGPHEQQLLTEGRYSSQYGSSSGDIRSYGASARYFVPQKRPFLLFLSAAYDGVRSPNASDELLLGGDNGLRGYPQRYQRGLHRAVFSAEERFYTDWYPLRLFRVGFAGYFDVGRAWSSQLPNATTGWLSDFGFGLRMLSTRASFGNVLHIDFAFPLHKRDPELRSRQFLIMTGKSF